jgi:hypothetical protein
MEGVEGDWKRLEERKVSGDMPRGLSSMYKLIRANSGLKKLEKKMSKNLQN